MKMVITMDSDGKSKAECLVCESCSRQPQYTEATMVLFLFLSTSANKEARSLEAVC